MTRVRPTRLTLGAIAAAVLAMDQLTKSLAVHLVDDGTVEWGPVSLAVVRNTGGPFGAASSFPVAWLVLVAVGAVAAVWALMRVGRLDGVTVAAAVVAGGVYGNLVDRVVRGRAGGAPGVVDWITVEPYPFAFNMADVALRLGAVALIVAAWRQRPDTIIPRSSGARPESTVASMVRPNTATDRREH